MNAETVNSIAQVAVQEAPAIIALIKSAFKRDNPDAVEPTDDEVKAGYEAAFWLTVKADDDIINDNS